MSELTLTNDAVAPPTPAAGSTVIYPRTTKQLYYKDDNGIEHPIEDTTNKNAASGYAGLTATYQLQLENNAGTFTNLLSNATSAARTWTMQDRDYTVAGTDDITGGTRAGSFTTLNASGLITGGVETGVELQTQGTPFSVHTASAMFNGTRDDVGYFAYNLAPGNTSGKVNVSEPTLKLAMEANYNDGTDHYMEYNMDYVSSAATGGVWIRPLGFRINRATNVGDWGFAARKFDFYKTTLDTAPWFRIDLTNATDTGIAMRFAGGASELFQFGPLSAGSMTSFDVGYGSASGVGGYLKTTSTAAMMTVGVTPIASATSTGLAVTGVVSATSSITSSGQTSGIGYATGAGGAVTQTTSRTTGVTLNTVCGSIQTDTSSLAAGTAATFVVTNSAIAIGDVPVVAIRSGSNGGNTTVQVVGVTNNSCSIQVSNNNAVGGAAETGAIIINFAIIKAVTA